MRVLNKGNRSAFPLLYHRSSDVKVHGRQRFEAKKGMHHRVWVRGTGRGTLYPWKAFIVTLSEAFFSVHCWLRSSALSHLFRKCYRLRRQRVQS